MVEKDDQKIGLEETELRLGLPGSNKRGFSDTMDLKLNLSSNHNTATADKDRGSLLPAAADHLAKPPGKAQVVGWPPVRSHRMNALVAARRSEAEVAKAAFSTAGLVKVSVDGAPYLRKIDLKMYKSYQDLSLALATMFPSFNIAGDQTGSQATTKDYMNAEGKLKDVLAGSVYVSTYEDKDGDWMLVGDVPWEMFVETCKRLRIIKGKEAVGVAPKAPEKKRANRD